VIVNVTAACRVAVKINTVLVRIVQLIVALGNAA